MEAWGTGPQIAQITQIVCYLFGGDFYFGGEWHFLTERSGRCAETAR